MNFNRGILIAAATVAAAFAQQQTPVYSTATYFHVADDKAQAYVEFSRTHTKKMMELALKEDPALRAVLLTRVVYGGNPEPRGNYVLITIREGSPQPGRELRDSIAQKALGMKYADYIAKSAAYRTRVGQTLSRQVATAGTEGAAEGDLIGYDYMKIMPGRMADYFAMEQNDFKPIHEQNIKDGKMKRWGLWSVRLPGGDDRPYDAITAQTYKDWESALSRVRFEAAYRQAQPGKNFVDVAEKARTTRKRVRSEMRSVVWVVARPR